MNFNSIVDHFEITKRFNKEKVQAKCPAHADNNASLTISHKGNKTVLHCHAGCTTEEVCNAVGLRIGNLFDEEMQIEKIKETNSNIEAVYKFTDEEGRLLYEKIRFKGKKFSHRRYINGSIVWGMEEGIYTETFPGSNEYSKKDRIGAKEKWFPSQEHSLYNIHNLVQAVKEEQIIFIVEGEKDADNLIKRCLVATTTSIGATKGDIGRKWLKKFNTYFQNADVILIPDNDLVGKNFMDHVAGQLNGIANSVKIIELPNLSEKEDVSDWLEEGNDIYDLKDLIKKTEEWSSHKGNIINNYNWSDVGNAERLVDLYGKDIKFNINKGKWFIWKGTHWTEDTEFKVENLYRNVLRRFQRQIKLTYYALEDIDKEKAEKRANAFVLKCESDNKIKATLSQAKTFKNMHFMKSDENNYLFNTPNGTFDLKEQIIREHKREDLITQCSNYSYSSENYCPNWLDFLNKIFLDNKELITYIQKAIGYSLTGDMSEQCLFMLWGGGANGKSTFVRALEDIMGTYAATIKGETLMETKNNDGARGDLARLTNKRVVIASELQEGQVFNEPLLKVLSAGETLPVRFMYQEEFMLQPRFKLWIMTNKKPKVKGNDYGIWRRWRMIPFKYTFKDEEKDPNFYEKNIITELPAILNWAIEGYKKWQEEGFGTPLEILESVEDYKNEMDQVARFLEDECITQQDLTCAGSLLYETYKDWCMDEGETYRMTNNKFSSDLKEKGFINKRTNRGKIWEGIALKSINNYRSNNVSRFRR